MGIVESVIIVS